MKARALGLAIVLTLLSGCGDAMSSKKAPTETELETMNDKMKEDMGNMKLPLNPKSTNDPMKGMNVKPK